MAEPYGELSGPTVEAVARERGADGMPVGVEVAGDRPHGFTGGEPGGQPVGIAELRVLRSAAAIVRWALRASRLDRLRHPPRAPVHLRRYVGERRPGLVLGNGDDGGKI